MNSIKFLLTTLLSIIVLNVHGQTLSKGVSKDLADHRKANISNVIYDLTFNIPANMNEKVTGKNVITFDLEEKTDVILDFQGGFNETCYVISGKRAKRRQAVATYQNEHIVIPMKYLQEGTNKVELSFTCLDKALNRHQDYMYTLFVPDHARSAYPCFDQPDLRARYLTEINAPKGLGRVPDWVTLSARNHMPPHKQSAKTGGWADFCRPTHPLGIDFSLYSCT